MKILQIIVDFFRIKTFNTRLEIQGLSPIKKRGLVKGIIVAAVTGITVNLASKLAFRLFPKESAKKFLKHKDKELMPLAQQNKSDGPN